MVGTPIPKNGKLIFIKIKIKEITIEN